MPVRPPPPSGSCSTPASRTRSAKSTRAPPSWTGWSRSRSAVSRSPPPPPSASGRATRSRSSTRPATSTSRSRWSGRCACSTVRSRCTTASPASSRRPRTSGGRRTSTTSPGCASSTSSTGPAPTSSAASQMMVDRLNATPLVLQIPIGLEADFIGVVDLVGMRALTWRGETQKGEDYAIEEIPADLADSATEWREKLIETLADVDDAVMEKLPRGRGDLRRGHQGRHPPGHHRRQGQPGAAPAPRSRTRASSRCSTRSIDLPAVAAGHPGHRGHRDRRRDADVAQAVDLGEPFSGLAFKIQTDKHLGKLTYVRIYSGVLESGSQVVNSTKDRKERIGKIYQMHANKREELPLGAGRRHHRGSGSQADHHRRHAVRPGEPGHPRVDDLPGAGHRGGHRAEDQGRPGEARHRDPAAGRGGPDLPRQQRRGDRSDGHLRHGRAAPGDPGRPDAPRVQRRGQRRQAAGGVPRDHPPQGGQGRVHPQEADRWFRPVRDA